MIPFCAVELRKVTAGMRFICQLQTRRTSKNTAAAVSGIKSEGSGVTAVWFQPYHEERVFGFAYCSQVFVFLLWYEKEERTRYDVWGVGLAIW